MALSVNPAPKGGVKGILRNHCIEEINDAEGPNETRWCGDDWGVL